MYWSPQLLGHGFQKARHFTASSHQNAGFSIWVFKNFQGVIPPNPHSGRGSPLPHLTPSPAFGRARGASAPVLGSKPWTPSTFQPWLRPGVSSESLRHPHADYSKHFSSNNNFLQRSPHFFMFSFTKFCSDGNDVIDGGSMFQTLAASTGKAWSPMVLCNDHGTCNNVKPISFNSCFTILVKLCRP